MSAPQSPSAAEQVLWPDTLQSELRFAKRMARFGVANTALVGAPFYTTKPDRAAQ
jgi:hypothetical protein